MGHRKKSAPRRGSLAFRPRMRKGSLIPTLRSWPELLSEKPALLAFIGFKAGTIHTIITDDRKSSPNFGKPLFLASTVISCPPIQVIGFRAYRKTPYGLQAIKDVYTKKLPKELERKVRIKNQDDEALTFIEDHLSEVSTFRAIVLAFPKLAGLSQKKPFMMEIGVSGGIKDAFEYLKKLMGKEVRVSDVFKSGMYVDTIGVSKGKGFEGPVTRFGIKRKQHKSRKSVRAVGTLGPWKPASVMYTIARAGQRGFHQRTEYNKRILLVSNEKDNPITPKGGFPHFGLLKDDYLILKGSTVGIVKRPLVLRRAIRAKEFKVQETKIISISTRE
ncbi:MAG: 50S ribosomal protein L3 [Nitrososphaerales archaeon]